MKKNFCDFVHDGKWRGICREPLFGGNLSELSVRPIYLDDMMEKVNYYFNENKRDEGIESTLRLSLRPSESGKPLVNIAREFFGKQ